MKILIAYFSRKGDNYFDSGIRYLEVGNTEIVARKIRELAGGELFHIEAVHAYSEDYQRCTEEARRELRENARPALTAAVADMDAAGTVFLGYPNWWGTMPMAVFTFLESYDFTGKRIAPFCTHEGSGMGRSERDIARLCPKSELLPGLALRGSEVEGADGAVAAWLRALSITA